MLASALNVGSAVVSGPLGGRRSTAATVPVSGCARFAAMRTALSMPYRLPSIADAVDELREGEAGRHGGPLVDDHGPGNRRPTDRARQHRRAAFRANEQDRLQRRGQPARQVVVDLELADGTRGGATEDA